MKYTHDLWPANMRWDDFVASRKADYGGREHFEFVGNDGFTVRYKVNGISKAICPDRPYEFEIQLKLIEALQNATTG